jgi:hypothetical protein
MEDGRFYFTGKIKILEYLLKQVMENRGNLTPGPAGKTLKAKADG